MQVSHVREHLCVAVAARILGTKKRNVKKELLHTPLPEITVFYFLVGYKGFLRCSWTYEMRISCQGQYQLSCGIETCYCVNVTAVAAM
jgi:hypothetical protein